VTDPGTKQRSKVETRKRGYHSDSLQGIKGTFLRKACRNGGSNVKSAH
jgi:hypothetical protein